MDNALLLLQVPLSKIYPKLFVHLLLSAQNIRHF